MTARPSGKDGLAIQFIESPSYSITIPSQYVSFRIGGDEREHRALMEPAGVEALRASGVIVTILTPVNYRQP